MDKKKFTIQGEHGKTLTVEEIDESRRRLIIENEHGDRKTFVGLEGDIVGAVKLTDQ